MYTGSSYRNTELYEGGFLGEGVANSSVLTIKTHYPYLTQKQQFQASHVILLIRHPMGAFITEYERALAGEHLAVPPPDNINISSATWNTYVHTNLTGWDMMHRFWLGKRNVQRFHIVHYEDLKRNFTFELKKVLQFLKFDASRINMRCVLQNSEGKFHKPKVNRGNRQKLLDLLSPSTKRRLKHVYRGVLNLTDKHRTL